MLFVAKFDYWCCRRIKIYEGTLLKCPDWPDCYFNFEAAVGAGLAGPIDSVIALASDIVLMLNVLNVVETGTPGELLVDELELGGLGPTDEETEEIVVLVDAIDAA